MDIVFVHFTVDTALENGKGGDKVHVAGYKIEKPRVHTHGSLALGEHIEPMILYLSVVSVPFYVIPFLAYIPSFRKGDGISGGFHNTV